MKPITPLAFDGNEVDSDCVNTVDMEHDIGATTDGLGTLCKVDCPNMCAGVTLGCMLVY